MHTKRINVPPPSAEDLAKTPPSVLLWFEARIAALEARIQELEAKLGMNSGNSNLPPSSDNPFDKPHSKAKAPKKRGKRSGIRQEMLEPSEVRVCAPEACICGCRKILDLQEYYRHQCIETLKPTLEITHFVLQRVFCAHCGKKVKAHITQEFRTGFGEQTHALIVELVGMHGLSRSKAQSFLASVYGLRISQGALQKCLDRASTALVPHYEALRAAAHTAEA